MDYKKLWADLMRFFEDTHKTGWGKVQIVQKMSDMEIEQAREETSDERRPERD